MLGSKPKLAPLVPESTHDSAFDYWIYTYIDEVLGADGYPVESSLWLARRTGDYLVREALAGNMSKTHLGLAAIDSKSQTMGLSVKHEALLMLDRQTSEHEKDPIVERVRNQFLGNLVLQLTWDRDLPEFERAFSSSDVRQFVGSRFSFEMRRNLLNMLYAQNYSDPEVLSEINNIVNLPPYQQDTNTAKNQGPSAISSSTDVSEDKVPKSKFFDESMFKFALDEDKILVPCPMCRGQKKIFEPSSIGKGLMPVFCGRCGGSGTIPEKT